MRFFIVPFLALIFTAQARAQIITTYAGNGTYGSGGNGGPATSAQLADPLGIVTDNGGNLYICDQDNNVIRKVSSSGIISIFAGTGVIGYTGDGGPATAAKLYHPDYITIDHLGNIYFTDQNDQVVRRISASGIISSITGNLGYGYTGDGGPASNAQFGSLSGLGFDSNNNLYITDYSFGVVRKVDASGIIHTIAGTGTPGYTGDGGPAIMARLQHPYEVVFNAAGTMFIPDAQNRVIRQVTSAGIITTLAGNGSFGYTGDGGPATAATMAFPWHIVLDGPGNLYISDALNDVVRKVTPAGTITTFAGNGTHGYTGDGGPATAAQMIDIGGIACDNGNNIYIVNRDQAEVVRKINNCLTATITQQPAPVALCNSGNAAFSVTAGNTTGLRWQLDTGSGWNDLADNGTYNGTGTATLTITGADATMNNYKFRCSLLNGCGTIFTQPATLTVNTPAAPSLSIITSAAVICGGTNVTFTATPVLGGSAPVFQWTKNGTPTGSNNPVYTDNTLNNGDQVSCRLTSNAACTTTPAAQGNIITMTVTPTLDATAIVGASRDTACAGTMVNFICVVTNAGSTPSYQWKKNGFNTGFGGNAYVDNGLQNGDIISCLVTSSYSCPLHPTVSSNPVKMTILPQVTPVITISSTAVATCYGQPVHFSASISGGGAAPGFQWTKNGVNTGTNTNGYTDNNIIAGDRVACTLSSSAACLSNPTAASNTIVPVLYPKTIVSLDHNSNLCAGAVRILDAGSFTSYQWSDNSSSRTLPASHTGKYFVAVTDANGCRGSDTADISTLLPAPSGFLPADTAICSYGNLVIRAAPGYNQYLWDDNSFSPGRTVTKPGLYYLDVTDNNGCRGRDSISIVPKQCLTGFYIPNAFTPNHDGLNDGFRPLIFGNIAAYRFTIYNRYGQVVFQSDDPGRFWDGSFHGALQDRAVFIWTCRYRLQGNDEVLQKGTVLLTR